MDSPLPGWSSEDFLVNIVYIAGTVEGHKPPDDTASGGQGDLQVKQLPPSSLHQFCPTIYPKYFVLFS